jgi:hypothetical protein
MAKRNLAFLQFVTKTIPSSNRRSLVALDSELSVEPGAISPMPANVDLPETPIGQVKGANRDSVQMS